MDTKGGKLRWGGDGGVLNWAIGIDMYKVMCIKLMTDSTKKQQQNKTNHWILQFWKVKRDHIKHYINLCITVSGTHVFFHQAPK